MLKLQEFIRPAGKLTAAMVLGLLVGCGGGGGSDRILGVADVVPDAEAPAADETVRVGSGSGSDFVNGVLATGIGSNASLSPGGSTTFTVTVVDSEGALSTTETTFNFGSGCVAAATASFDSPSVVTTSGTATVTYTAEGCVGDDTITASAELIDAAANALTATATINVEAEDVLSLEFVSASPSAISITGSGGIETSTVTFRVLGESGNPVTNQSISFILDTDAGGAAIPVARQSAVSDINGEVSTIVQAGTVPTPVRVTATDDATGIATQSSGLSIGTAITDDNSFDAVRQHCNPSAWDFTGNTVVISTFLGDAFNNSPPDDTAVSFTTNGGSIQSACLTAGGSCSVTWTGQNPRPNFIDANGTARPGDALILAYTTGSESFDDDNGNGVFDEGDSGSFGDVGEPYFDENQNGSYDSGERFIDTDDNQSYGFPDGLYNGPSCEHSTLCADLPIVTIWDSIPIVMSSNIISLFFADGATMPAPGDTLVVADSVVSGFSGLFIGDENGNAPPIGTTFSITATNGTIESDTGFTLESSCDPIVFPISLSGDSESSGGLLKLTIDPPNRAPQVFTWSVVD